MAGCDYFRASNRFRVSTVLLIAFSTFSPIRPVSALRLVSVERYVGSLTLPLFQKITTKPSPTSPFVFPNQGVFFSGGGRSGCRGWGKSGGIIRGWLHIRCNTEGLLPTRCLAWWRRFPCSFPSVFSFGGNGFQAPALPILWSRVSALEYVFPEVFWRELNTNFASLFLPFPGLMDPANSSRKNGLSVSGLVSPPGLFSNDIVVPGSNGSPRWHTFFPAVPGETVRSRQLAWISIPPVL